MPKRKLELKCPHCGGSLSPALIRRLNGHLLGSVKSKAKARSSEVARAAVQARWAKARAREREE